MPRVKPGVLTHRLPDGIETHLQLHEDVTTLGRSSSCTIVIPVLTVSRVHARIELQHDRYMLFNTESANGTFVNGQPIEQGHRLSTGDVIWLGSEDVTLHFSDPEETLVVSRNTPPPQLAIDESARTVSVYGVPVHLTPLEYDLLLHLARNPGTVCTREGCFRAVWGEPYDPATCEDAFNGCITRLRRNLREAAESVGQDPPPITTIPRIGFRLDAVVTFTPRPQIPLP